MKEKRTHDTRKKLSLFLMLIAVLTTLFSTTALADNPNDEFKSPTVIYFDDIVGNSDPVFVVADNLIKNSDADGLRVRYEKSESSDENFPGTKAYYSTNPHEVRWFELDGVTYSLWRVKSARYGSGINLVLIPANNDTSNYTGYLHSWKYDGDNEEPCVITIKNSVEPENCFTNFENSKRKYKVVIDEGTDNMLRLEEDKDYYAYSGSTVIEIEPKIIKHLSNGTHTVTVHFADGRCKVNFVKDVDDAYSVGTQPMNTLSQASQQTSAQNVTNGKKQAPKTGEI